jgi:hypothetical protein
VRASQVVCCFLLGTPKFSALLGDDLQHDAAADGQVQALDHATHRHGQHGTSGCKGLLRQAFGFVAEPHRQLREARKVAPQIQLRYVGRCVWRRRHRHEPLFGQVLKASLSRVEDAHVDPLAGSDGRVLQNGIEGLAPRPGFGNMACGNLRLTT